MKRFRRTLKTVFKKLMKIYLIGAIIGFIFIALPMVDHNIDSIQSFFIYTGMAIAGSILGSILIITLFFGSWISYYIMYKLGTDVVDTVEESESKNIDTNVYYRDIPEGYNPAIASLILNKWFEQKTDMTAMTLYMIKKGYLKKDGKDIIYTDKDMSDLPQSERSIVEMHKSGNKYFNYEQWKKIVIQEAQEKGYVENIGQVSPVVMKKKIQNIVIIGFASMMILNMFASDYVGIIIMFILSLIVPFTIITLIIMFYRRARINVKLTEKGLVEQEKLVKLRKFLEDFSTLEKSDDSSVVLWEDYLIYAISLGVNTDIVEKSTLYKQLNYGTYSINQELASDLSHRFSI